MAGLVDWFTDGRHMGEGVGMEWLSCKNGHLSELNRMIMHSGAPSHIKSDAIWVVCGLGYPVCILPDIKMEGWSAYCSVVFFQNKAALCIC
ncbi:hypothetical protein Nepgr_000078 [Nepenthes gracilis]|uniref:Uncharacterized protein n=1 Tax=Nepenthes gracilis TaxID=150966 RepID=A0AAD3P5L5_NEPGR|nr:hypothetical protein Nepgr_000078 [Nepenthes gracilis]